MQKRELFRSTFASARPLIFHVTCTCSLMLFCMQQLFTVAFFRSRCCCTIYPGGENHSLVCSTENARFQLQPYPRHHRSDSSLKRNISSLKLFFNEKNIERREDLYFNTDNEGSLAVAGWRTTRQQKSSSAAFSAPNPKDYNFSWRNIISLQPRPPATPTRA